MKENRNHTLSGWLAMLAGCSAFLFIVLQLAGTVQAAVPTARQVAAAAAEATATPTATAAQSTAGTLAVAADGFDAWCAPQQYALKKPTGPETPDYANKLVKQGDKLQIKIPAAYCVLTFRFDQPLPKDAVLTIYDAKSPFLRLPLQAVDGKPDEGWVIVKHLYVVNPPLWSVRYTLGVSAGGSKDFWSQQVLFAKPLPKPCRYGGYPNPVTMYCIPYDKWEIEPKPGVHYPYPRTPIP